MTFIPVLFLLFACGVDLETASAEVHDDHEQQGAHGEHGDEAAEVALSPEAMVSARIQVGPVVEGALAPEITLPARIQLDPRKEAVVSAWIGGQVGAISVRVGDTVKKGQRLGSVQSPELGSAVGAYRGAKARDEAIEARLERVKRLEKDGVASRAQVLDAEAAHAESDGAMEAAEERLRILGLNPAVGDHRSGKRYPSHIPVRTPIAGKVLTAQASVGRSVQPGDTLFRIGNLDEVWLLMDVYERDLAEVQVDQGVRFTVDAWPGEVFEGRVDQVGDWIQPESRTVEVRVVVPNPDHRLKPNMFASATLALSHKSATRGFVLPAGAVQEIEGADVVFVQEEEGGHFEARKVQVLERNSSQVLIGTGLSADERVVTEGAFALKSELAKGELGEGHAH